MLMEFQIYVLVLLVEQQNQGGVQPKVYTQFEDQKLPRGFMPMEFRISVLVLCTYY